MSFEDNYYETGEDEDFIPYNLQESYADNDSDYSSVSTNRKKQRNYNDELKMSDKGFHKLKHYVNSKKVYIEVYSTSSLPGAFIRDAITGSRYNDYRVGSKAS